MKIFTVSFMTTMVNICTHSSYTSPKYQKPMNTLIESLKEHLEYVKTIGTKPNHIWRLFRKLHPENTEEIMKLTSFLDLNKRNRKITFFERIFCVLNNITEIPKCKYCHENEVDFERHNGGKYFDYCCNSCS